MNDASDFDRTLRRWLEAEVASPAPQDLLRSILVDTSTVAPRFGWVARLRWLRLSIRSYFGASVPLGTTTRFAWAAVVLLLIGVLLAVALATGARPRLPAPFGPAANGVIVFAAGGDLFTGDPVTGKSHRIAAEPEDESSPVVSPDGRHVAFFRSTPDGLLEIVVAAIDGSHPVVVTPVPKRDFTWMDWAPDGRSITFTSPEDDSALEVAAADGSGIRTLVDDMQVNGPVFRPPGGGEILFRGRNADGIGIYVMRADGTNRRTLVGPTTSNNIERDLAEPRYSPDGSLIAYQRWSDSIGQMRVFVMNADGAGSRPLPHDPDTWYEGWPVWSPDGTRLAIQRIFNDISPGVPSNKPPLALIAVDGRTAAVPIGSFMDGGGLRVEWSPDGNVLLAKSDIDPQVFLDPGGGLPRAPTWVSTSYPAWQRLAP